jgi:phage-related protein
MVSLAIAGVISWIVQFMAQLGVWEAIWNTMLAVLQFAVNNMIIVWNFFTGIIASGIAAIRFILEGLAAFLSGDFSGAWTALQNLIAVVWGVIQNIVTTAVAMIQNIITLAMAVISAVWSVQWNAMMLVAATMWNVIRTVIATALGAIQAAISSALSFISSIWSAVWNTISSITSGVVNTIRVVLGGLMVIFISVIAALTNMRNMWTSIWSGIAGAIGGVVGTIIGVLGGIISVLQSIISMASALGSLASKAAGSLPIIGPAIEIGKGLFGQAGLTNIPANSTFFAGENGTEMIRLHGRGASVVTANKTSMMMNGSHTAGSGPLVGVLNVYGASGSPDDIQHAVEEALMAVVDRDRARRPR